MLIVFMVTEIYIVTVYYVYTLDEIEIVWVLEITVVYGYWDAFWLG